MPQACLDPNERQESNAWQACTKLDDLNIKCQTSGADKYPAKSHARRVASKLGVQNGLILLRAAQLEFYSNSDMPAPFRQDRYFYYLSGCNEWNCYITYDIALDKLTLWLPSIDKSRVVWTGRGSTVEEALDKYDIDEAKYIKNGPAFPIFDFGKEYERCPHVARQQDHLDVARTSEKRNSHRIFCLQKLRMLSSYRTNYLRVRAALDDCRVNKDEHEIELIRRANQITAEAHINVMRNLHAFKNEAEVEGAYMQTCISRHAKTQAYAPIVGAGPNGATLHYSANEADFGDGQTIVLDAGCEVSCYASDVTRTLPLNKKSAGRWPSKEAEKIYQLVAFVQETCIRSLRPNVSFASVAWQAIVLIVEGLLDLGILQGKAEDILKAGTVMAFYPHGLGHHVGLEVHDVQPDSIPPTCLSKFLPHVDISVQRSNTLRDLLYGACKSKKPNPDVTILDSLQKDNFVRNFETGMNVRGEPPLKPGMVITIEPGIYFNKTFLEDYFLNDPTHSKFINQEVLKRYMNVGGVRIEDDILITKNGNENLTTAPKGEDMLKIIRMGARKTGEN